MGGPSVASLLILSSLCVYAFLNHLFFALRKPLDRLHLLLAGICLVLAGFGLSEAVIYQAQTISGYVAALKWNLSYILIFFMLFPWFIAEFTGFYPRKWLQFSTVAFGMIFLANLMQPFSLQFTEIKKLDVLRLPWGEEIIVPVGQHGFLFWLAAFAALVMTGFAILALAAAWHRNRNRVSLAMLLTMLIWSGTVIEGILVRASVIDFIHLGPYGCLIMVITVSLISSCDTCQRLALLDFAMNNVHEAAFLGDHAGRLYYVNDESCRALGYRRDELLGLPMSTIYPDLQQGRLHRYWEELKGKGSVLIEGCYRSKDGFDLPVEISANAFTYVGRRYILFLARDIRTRFKAEEKLRMASEEWQTTFDSTSDLFFLIDKDFKISKANKAAATFLNQPQEEIVGKHCYQLMHTSDLPPLECPLSKLQQTMKHEDSELYLKDREMWMQVSVDPIFDKNGELLRVVHIVRDITNRKKLEDQLRQAQKMEAIGTLAGGVAHDFNNMLSIIIGYTELALDRDDTTLELNTHLKEVRKAAGRSADLTRQLLTFARKQAIAPRVLNVNEAVTGMLKMLQRLIGEAVEIVWQPGDDLWPLWMDPSQVDQILANLCVNARDAIAGTGTITIATRNIIIDMSDGVDLPEALPGQYVLLAIHDNGCGMDNDTISKIFEPFFTTKGHREGTGLGLATVYGIVKQNNGHLRVHSKPGIGSTFNIYLPKHFGMSTSPGEPIQADPLPRGTETILLVEDAQPILKMVIHMLKSYGYQVLAASSPEEALQIARRNTGTIDLLLTDVVMPGMNGRELAKAISAILPRIKCLYMSGHAGNVMEGLGISEEGLHFIQKPFSVQTLAVKLHETLNA